MYSRVNWKNAPNTDTPITAENLNVMDRGIFENAEAIDSIRQNVLSLEARVSALETSVNNLTESIKTINDTLTDHEDRIKALEG